MGAAVALLCACEPIAGPSDDSPAADAGPDGAPSPDTGRIGEPPPAPVDGLLLLWGAESLMLTADGQFDGPAGMGNPGTRIELELFDADGAPIEVLSGDPGLYPVPGPWTRQVWWPASVRPASATYRLYADDALLREADIAHIGDVPIADAACDPNGIDDRCAAPSVCFGDGAASRPPGYGRAPTAADAPAPGRCVALSLTAWRADDVVLVDARADDPEVGDLPMIGAFAAEGFTGEVLRRTYRTEGWRRFAYLRGELSPQLDLYIGPHLAARDVPVQAIAERPRDAACDPERLIDRCVAGTACGPLATCRAISAPIVDRLTAVIDVEGTIGLIFEGRDPQADVDSVLVDLMGADGRLIQRYGFDLDYPRRPNRFGGVPFEGHVEQDGGPIRGSLVFTHNDPGAMPVRVRMALEDDEDLIGETIEAALGQPSPTPVRAGDVCDPFEVLNTCPGDTFCDRADGSEGPMTCHRPPAECPLDLPVLDGVADGNNGPLPDRTMASCTWSRGNIGNEQAHAFTATRGGTHRFVAEAIDYNAVNTLFVRRYCGHPRADDSELACRHVEDNVDASQPLTLDVELVAGETIYVFVEAAWTGGGAYTLSVDPPL